jgi:5-methylcytosine-specific restriction endonuclease McrA
MCRPAFDKRHTGRLPSAGIGPTCPPGVVGPFTCPAPVVQPAAVVRVSDGSRERVPAGCPSPAAVTPSRPTSAVTRAGVTTLLEVTDMASGRDTRQWKEMAKQVRALGLGCWLCGEDIDYYCDPCSPRSFSVDHVVPLSKGGALLDPANLRPAHFGCNARKKDGEPPAIRVAHVPSQRW